MGVVIVLTIIHRVTWHIHQEDHQRFILLLLMILHILLLLLIILLTHQLFPLPCILLYLPLILPILPLILYLLSPLLDYVEDHRTLRRFHNALRLLLME